MFGRKKFENFFDSYEAIDSALIIIRACEKMNVEPNEFLLWLVGDQYGEKELTENS